MFPSFLGELYGLNVMGKLPNQLPPLIPCGKYKNKQDD